MMATRMMKILAVLTVLVHFAVGITYARAVAPIELSYGDIDQQKLDIYAKNTKAGAPVMINVHGGGWHIGSKDNAQKKPAAFNDEGVVFVSVGYPLLPDYPVETQAQSVATAIVWVLKNIEDYNGDPANVHVMGHSAGAHLVALSVLDPKYLGKYGVSATSIRSVTSVDGATMNVPWRMRSLEEEGRLSKRMFASAFGRDRAYWQSVSPSHYISVDRAIPPFLFLTAGARQVSNLAAERMVERITNAGGVAQIVPIEGRNHASINRRLGGRRDPAFLAIMRFIHRADVIEFNSHQGQ